MKKTALLLMALLVSSSINAKENVDLIIKNGQILTMNTAKKVIDNGVIVVQKDRIIAIGEEALLAQYQGNTIDAEGGIVIPGMINTHNHLPMIAFRGLGEEGIENRLFAYFFPLEGAKLSRDLIYKATIHGTIDLALGGVTTYADMYYHMDEMARASKEVGIRAVLGETIIKYPVVDAPTPYGGLEYAVNFIKEYQGDELITPAFGPHAAYTVSEEKLREIAKLQKELNAPVLIHLAENVKQPLELSEMKGKKFSETEFLNEVGLLNENTIVAHAIALSDNDIKLLNENNVGIAYNPMANAKGATGIARVKEMQDQGMLNIGLGTDGPMSSNQVDLFRTLSYASTMQRIKYNDRTIMTPDVILELATIGGARALNMADEIGSLEVGKKADIVIIETDSANMMPNYDPYATIVFQANPANVDTTIINGKIIVEDKVLKTYDLQKNRKNMEQISADIATFAKELAVKAKTM